MNYRRKTAIPRSPSRLSLFFHLDEHRVALGMARADAADPDAAAPALQLVAERHEDPGARCADRVAVGNRAAVHVNLFEHFLLAHAEDRACADDGHRGEGLVDLD